MRHMLLLCDNRADRNRAGLSNTLASAASRPDNSFCFCRSARRRWGRRRQIRQIQGSVYCGAAGLRGLDHASERRARADAEHSIVKIAMTGHCGEPIRFERGELDNASHCPAPDPGDRVRAEGGKIEDRGRSRAG
jgi:hypothetical protein